MRTKCLVSTASHSFFCVSIGLTCVVDQVRGRWDFDETVAVIKDLSKHWPQCSSKIIEAQALGAALSSHLKHQISGIIPINVKGSKELRALNCVPVWRSKNVYIPKPDDDEYAWVRDYVSESQASRTPLMTTRSMQPRSPSISYNIHYFPTLKHAWL